MFAEQKQQQAASSRFVMYARIKKSNTWCISTHDGFLN